VKEDAARLFGLFVCARRPLSWHEIQGAVSIDLDRWNIDFEERQLRDSSKSLCGSLVENYSDGHVGLVHHTTRM
jgi:hypothetical protein